MTRKLEPYEPRPVDLAWARTQIMLLRHGGRLATSTGTYRVDKNGKKVTLVSPASPWDNPMTFLMHHRSHYVFAAIGWTVEPVVEWDKIELPDREPLPGDDQIIPREVFDVLVKLFVPPQGDPHEEA